jgi:hypothetical protein
LGRLHFNIYAEDILGKEIPMNKSRIVFTCLSIGVLMTMTLACRRAASPLPDISEQSGNSGLQAETFGDERLVTLAQGNLARFPATNAEERTNALSSFLLDHPAYFGMGNVQPVNIAFATAGPEFKIIRQRESFMMVALHQLYQGAPVIDETQFGAFLLDSSGRVTELRRVRAQISDST